MINKSILLLILNVVIFSQSFGQDGSLDNSFGNNGISSVDFNSNIDYGRAVAIQSDGKILISGSSNSNIALCRLNPNGTLDVGFGDFGKVTTSLSTQNDSFAIEIQNDGKIILAGYASGYSLENPNEQIDSFILIRYLSNGLIDSSFGNNGVVKQNFGDINRIFRTLSILPDGKILAAGDAYLGSHKEFFLMCFNTNGSLDTAFGNQGVFNTIIGNNINICSSIAIQPSGKIILAGSTGVNVKNILVVAVNENGTLDTSFGQEGKVIIAISGISNDCKSVKIQPDGKIVLAGDVFISTGNFDFALIRLNHDGTFDNSFGNNGIVIKNILANDKCSTSIIQSNGDIILIGTTNTNNVAKVALCRFKNTGLLDNNFGNNGVVTINPGEQNNDWYYGLSSVSEYDGNIIIGGHGRIQFEYNFIAMRIVSNNGLGLLNNVLLPNVIIYPNPTKNGIINLKSNSQINYIEVFDFTGKLVLKEYVVSNKVDLSILEMGTYLLKFEVNNEVVFNKIIIN
jgi:uncharacterized delta-60 repeat protein